ncbi:hypothetical protein J9317_13995 [Metabacillus sp. KIGAM252]|uniref:Uncharacterized protein n=1 Tax=Metabacillus flavus TaxID=2823519 RepID=A0ABS5LGK3_9BACI|nr:hypothetical protein [Metabacillus flavus]MBS2969880.1 hypothetical protein [Metabacillus flavus]
MKNKKYTLTLTGFWLITASYGLFSFFHIDVFPVDDWIIFVMDPIYRLMFGGT